MVSDQRAHFIQVSIVQKRSLVQPQHQTPTWIWKYKPTIIPSKMLKYFNIFCKCISVILIGWAFVYNHRTAYVYGPNLTIHFMSKDNFSWFYNIRGAWPKCRIDRNLISVRKILLFTNKVQLTEKLKTFAKYYAFYVNNAVIILLYRITKNCI